MNPIPIAIGTDNLNRPMALAMHDVARYAEQREGFGATFYPNSGNVNSFNVNINALNNIISSIEEETQKDLNRLENGETN